MTVNDQSVATDASQELVITRVFNAPRALVWQVWTGAEHASHWWCPDIFTIARCELDARPGGAIRLDMQGPDGTIYPMTGVYREVEEPAQLVFVTGAVPDPAGNPQIEIRNSVTLEADGDATRVTLQLQILKVSGEAAFAAAGMEMGWNQSLDKLGAWVESLV